MFRFDKLRLTPGPLDTHLTTGNLYTCLSCMLVVVLRLLLRKYLSFVAENMTIRWCAGLPFNDIIAMSTMGLPFNDIIAMSTIGYWWLCAVWCLQPPADTVFVYLFDDTYILYSYYSKRDSLVTFAFLNWYYPLADTFFVHFLMRSCMYIASYLFLLDKVVRPQLWNVSVAAPLLPH